MKYGKETVGITSLIRRGWMESEMRVKVNDDKATQYAEEMKDGADFPRPVVFVDPKTELYHVGDGFHRILAHQLNKQKTVDVDLRRGTKNDAVMFNIEANGKQRGLPFGRGDLKKCIVHLLTMPETKHWTQQRIAEFVGIQRKTNYVSKVVQELGLDRKVIVDKNGRVRTGKNEIHDAENINARRGLVVNMLLEGTTKKEIAELLGVNEGTVRRDEMAALRENELTTCKHCRGKGYITTNTRGKS